MGSIDELAAAKRPIGAPAQPRRYPRADRTGAARMKRRNRRPDCSYTIEEAASLLQVHRNTVRYWIKCGLPVFTDQRPHLIQGGDLVVFLKGRREANRQKCGPGQFFCLKCRRPQAPADGMVDYEPSTAARGTLVGICPACETLMYRFVSQARLAAIARHFNVQTTPSIWC
jgi:hypothetical protein